MKIILSTVCFVLLALFAYQVMSYPLDTEGNHNNNLDAKLAKSIDYELPQLAVLNGINEYSEIVQRPLFVKDRAAAVSVRAVNKVTTVDELAHLILVGTASSSEVEIAIIADTKAKQMERLKTGESYKEWNIAEVSSDHVVFQNAELEYKLFVTPIKGSQKDKQAKLISQLNSSKIEKAAAAIKSYNGWKGASKNSARSVNKTDSIKVSEAKNSISNRSWGYNKKYKPTNSSNEVGDGAKSIAKPVIRSPIKIPGEEERDAAYYESEDGDASASGSNTQANTAKEISAEDFYDDEDITEDELKALEGLGASIFDD
ncbi:MAG: hypothetical protein AB8B92_07845 [Gammaproteobacteria bacterium]